MKTPTKQKKNLQVSVKITIREFSGEYNSQVIAAKTEEQTCNMSLAAANQLLNKLSVDASRVVWGELDQYAKGLAQPDAEDLEGG